MLQDVVEVRPMEGYHLHLRFEDGVEGIVNIAELVSFEGLFAEVAEPEYFERVRVDATLGSVCWPNGADLDPDVLYARVTGEPILSLGPLAAGESLRRA